MLGKFRPKKASLRADKSVPLLAVLIVILATASWLSLTSHAAPVSITVPYSDKSVKDADLEGNPATGDWTDALSVEILLETGGPDPYGTSTLYAKHDGTYMFFRIDGMIDVPWAGASANRFWLGMQISAIRTSHHGGSEWDGIFLGLWNGDQYSPAPVYPPRAVDTHGFDRPPAKDALQDVVGALRYSGTAAPYSFTAEWKKPLDSGDPDDIVYKADGATVYNFFVTTDSDGGGSAGGAISHREVTNLNSMRIAVGQASGSLPTIVVEPPYDTVTGQSVRVVARVVDLDGVAAVRINYTDVTGTSWNETMAGSDSSYSHMIPAQDRSGVIAFYVWASDTIGNAARTDLFNIIVVKLLEVPSIQAIQPAGEQCLKVLWSPSGDPLAGYRVYRWNYSRMAMDEIAELSSEKTELIDCDLEAGLVYTYWVVAYDEEGNQSPPSMMTGGRISQEETEENPFPFNVGVVAPLAAFIILLVVFVAWLWRRVSEE